MSSGHLNTVNGCSCFVHGIDIEIGMRKKVKKVI